MRPEWFHTVAREVQVLAGLMLDLPDEGRRLAVEAVFHRLPAACDPIEALCLEGLRARAFEAARGAATRATPATADRVRGYIDTHLTEPLTIDTLSDALRLRPGVIRRSFCERFGTSVHGYVAHRRLRAATALLATGVKVQSVASSVGFHSRSTLYRLLSQETGLTPRQVTALPPGDPSRGRPLLRT